jgi:thioesterase domain-containing protein
MILISCNKSSFSPSISASIIYHGVEPFKPTNKGEAWVEIVCLQKENDKAPLYCMPTLAGSISSYVELAKILGADRPVYGIRLAKRAQTGTFEAFESVQAMAASIATKLMAHRRDGPICLIGYSSGAFLAVEVARQLVGQNKLVPFVGIIDRTPPQLCFTAPERMFFFVRNVGPWASAFVTKIITDPKHWSNCRNSILVKLRRQHRLHHHDWYQGLPEDRKTVVNQNIANGRKYRFEGIYRGTIFLFRQRQTTGPSHHLFRPHRLEDYGWRRITRANVRVVYILGTHGSCMGQPDVSSIAYELRQVLVAAVDRYDEQIIA